MAVIKQFEELICWKKARQLTKDIYQEFKHCRDFGLRDQIQRAAVSVMSNIAEGFERGTQQEFINYLYIAKGSAGEVRSQLYVALDAEYLNMETFKYLNNLVAECSKLIQSFSVKIKSGANRGSQFKHVLKTDPAKNIIKQYAPEVYERFYGNK